MRIFIAIFILCFYFLYAQEQVKGDDIANNKSIEPTSKLDTQEINKEETRQKATEDKINNEYEKIKAPPIKSDTLDRKSFFSFFKIHEPWYVLPAYYSFSKPYDPRLDNTEIKAQISFRFDILDNVICKFCSFNFDYTQRIYLQTYNNNYSSPLRDTDLSPGIHFVYKKPIPIYNGNGGYFNWFSLGYRHTSNGETEEKDSEDIRQPQYNNALVRSKALDRIIFETNYKFENLNVRFRAWFNMSVIAFDGAKTNGDISRYIGYGDIKASYTYNNDHLFEFYMNNILNNYFTSDYWNWKGQIELGYSYGVSKYYAIYVQYLYGYGDSLYEYSLPVNKIGIGIRLRDF